MPQNRGDQLMTEKRIDEALNEYDYSSLCRNTPSFASGPRRRWRSSPTRSRAHLPYAGRDGTVLGGGPAAIACGMFPNNQALIDRICALGAAHHKEVITATCRRHFYRVAPRSYGHIRCCATYVDVPQTIVESTSVGVIIAHPYF